MQSSVNLQVGTMEQSITELKAMVADKGKQPMEEEALFSVEGKLNDSILRKPAGYVYTTPFPNHSEHRDHNHHFRDAYSKGKYHTYGSNSIKWEFPKFSGDDPRSWLKK